MNIYYDEVTKALSTNFNEIIFGDGHTIYGMNMYTDLGIPEDAIKHLDRDYKKDNTPKGMQNDCHGIYNLDFLYCIAGIVNADTDIASSKMGRGFQAQELVKAITESVTIIKSTRKS